MPRDTVVAAAAHDEARILVKRQMGSLPVDVLAQRRDAFQESTTPYTESP